MKQLIIIFCSVFIAELGDKTQLAALLYSTDTSLNKWHIFGAASLALIASTFLAVLIGNQLGHWINLKYLKMASGMGFIMIGAWILWSTQAHGV